MVKNLTFIYNSVKINGVKEEVPECQFVTILEPGHIGEGEKSPCVPLLQRGKNLNF